MEKVKDDKKLKLLEAKLNIYIEMLEKQILEASMKSDPQSVGTRLAYKDMITQLQDLLNTVRS